MILSHPITPSAGELCQPSSTQSITRTTFGTSRTGCFISRLGFCISPEKVYFRDHLSYSDGGSSVSLGSRHISPDKCDISANNRIKHFLIIYGILWLYVGLCRSMSVTAGGVCHLSISIAPLNDIIHSRICHCSSFHLKPNTDTSHLCPIPHHPVSESVFCFAYCP